MLAPPERADEECDALVTKLNVRAQIVAVVTALDVNGLETCSLVVLENQVFIIVLAVDLELDFHQLAALESRVGRQPLAAETFNALANGLAAAAGHVDNLVVLDEPVDLAVDLDLQARVSDRVFAREIGQIGAIVERSVALLANEIVCEPAARAGPSTTNPLSNRKRSAGLIVTTLDGS